jgi:predicted RNA-binding Zn-ribbon protein involved in translation (DUF1610 family)
MPIVRTSPLYLKHANEAKAERLHEFLVDYRSAVQQVIDHVWDNGIVYGDRVFNVTENLLHVPSFLPGNCLPTMSTELSGRALKCASNQAMSMVGAAVARRKKDLHWLSKLKGSKIPPILTRRLAQPLVKPCAGGIKAELSSICAKLSWETSTTFDGWLEIFSIGKSYGRIEIPVNRHRHLNKLAQGKQLSGLLVSETRVDVRFSKEAPKREACATKVVGADTGLKSVLTLSDGQASPTRTQHGHSLESVCECISRKKKGSKAFAKAQAHRTNLINWSVNQLNFDYIAEVRLEKVTNINHGRCASRRMQAWTNSDIQRKVERLMEERNVSVKLQPSAYRSQRCSSCGNVRKANRKGKLYSCKRCGFICDADMNAARNHEQSLPAIPDAFFRKGRNLGHGFLWTSSGCFDLSGAEFAVPPSIAQA